ncbi:MAG: pyridoxamine 5'-phosphate oxidase family protein [Myxococcota bacterium]
MTELTRTDHSRIRRHPERGSYDRAEAYAVLDEALVAHVGFVHDGRPFVLPMVYARVGDALYFHGAVASRLLQGLASGVPACATVTLVDGLVLARAAFYHSMNYRSVVVMGTATLVPAEAKAAVFAAFVDKLEPGRAALVRAPSPQETAATALVALPIAEASLKRRSGGPMDREDEPPRAVWTGVVPLALTPSTPQPEPPRPAAGARPTTG